MVLQQDVQKIISNLCGSLEQFFPQAQPEAILFGSYARGDAEAGSDLDVLILVDTPRQVILEKNWQVGSLAADFLLDYGVVVSPIVENRDYFHANIDLLPFYGNIQREGVRVSA